MKKIFVFLWPLKVIYQHIKWPVLKLLTWWLKYFGISTFKIKDNLTIFFADVYSLYFKILRIHYHYSMCINYSSGPSCSKLTTSLVNVSLKFKR